MKAFITGIGGQDGYYLARVLANIGYHVVGCGRPGTLIGRRSHELRRMGAEIIELDLFDRYQTLKAVSELGVAEIYNLAGTSSVPESWEDPAKAISDNVTPALHLLEAIRQLYEPIRFFQASSADMFGEARAAAQNEKTPLAPASPLGTGKVLAHQLVALYREQYGLFACSGILFNHESPRRAPNFLAQKVALAANRIRLGQQDALLLGDLDVVRDWGYAGEYVEAMWLMLQQNEPADYVIGTGVGHSVRELCKLAFEVVGLDHREFVRLDPALKRHRQPPRQVADPSRAEEGLGWKAKTSFEELVQMMVDVPPGR